MEPRLSNLMSSVRARALAALIPPPRLQLSQWIEQNIRLPEGVSALPGRVRLWPYQREIADAISDPAGERVTLLKPTRVGEAPRLRLAARAAWPPGRPRQERKNLGFFENPRFISRRQDCRPAGAAFPSAAGS